MLASIFGKGLRDSWRTVVAWGLALAALGMLLVNTFASIPPEDIAVAGQMISSASDSMKALVGDVQAIGTIGGMLNWKFFIFFPLIMAIFTILQSTAAVAGEEERGTLDIILSCPVPRWRVVLEKFGALMVNTLGISFLATIGFWAGIRLFAADLAYERVLLAVLNGTLLALAAGAFALFVTGLVPGRRTAGIVTGVLLIASYFLNTLGAVSEFLRPYRPFSVFYHYSQSQPLTSSMVWGSAALLVALTAIFLAGAVLTFQRRDVGVGAPSDGLLARFATRGSRRVRPWAPGRFSLLNSVAGKALRDARWAIVALGASLGILAVAIMALYRVVLQFPDIERFLADMPAATRALMGEFSNLMTLPGFITIIFLNYLPVLLAVFIVTEAMEAIAGEEERRTADLLLCVPMARWRVLTEKILALLIGLLALNIAAFAGLVV
ncbi:MAG: ABC transporter permease subunit, partial [Chloroflexi bacterium]|nr:ABC transporter permease subunit [Chloroflexota bacterium]